MATGANRGPDPSDKTDEIIQTLRGYERPFMGTGELADELGYSSNPGVSKHLERAVESGRIEKTTVSGYNIWHLPDLVEESQLATGGRVERSGTESEDSADGPDIETHRMGQMGAKRIGVLAVGIGIVGGTVAQFPIPLIGLGILGIIGVVMIAWGVAPLFSSDTTTSKTGPTPAGDTNE